MKTLKNKNILAARKSLASEQVSLAAVICNAVKNCKHSCWGEAPYISYGDSSAPPTGVCFNCGLTEDAWGCGYVALHKHMITPPVPTTREELNNISTVRIWETDKGPLLRGETTVYKIVKTRLGL